MRFPKANDYVDAALKRRNELLAKKIGSDVLILNSGIHFGLDDLVRDTIEAMADARRRESLAVLVQTTGGYIEVVERIYAVLRRHYDRVSFFVPNYAYSAGTVLVLSGDEIYMDYYSVLGPIDPQVENADGQFVPGLGYLQKFKELVDTINEKPNAKAELAYLLKKFDPATLFALEQARNHSVTLLEEWLSRHKFKDWTMTERTAVPVDDAMRRARARAIATVLGDAERWHSHGRGIGLKELTSEEIKLKINDFGDDRDLSELFHGYFGLLVDYCGKIGAKGALHSRLGLRRTG